MERKSFLRLSRKFFTAPKCKDGLTRRLALTGRNRVILIVVRVYSFRKKGLQKRFLLCWRRFRFRKDFRQTSRKLAPNQAVDDGADGARLAHGLPLEHGERLRQDGGGEDGAQARDGR